MRSILFIGILLLFQGVILRGLGGGRAWRFAKKEEFEAWHLEYGPTARALGVWGIVLGAILIVAAAVLSLT